MSANKIYEILEEKILEIQLQASLYESMRFSQIGRDLWEEINDTSIANIHITIQNALFSEISLGIARLFDEREDTTSLHHLMEKLDRKSNSELHNSYNKIKSSHRLKKIIDFRHQAVAHNASKKETNGFSQDDIDYIVNDILLFIENLFRIFNPECSICNNISGESRRLSEQYLRYLLYGFKKRLEI